MKTKMILSFAAGAVMASIVGLLIHIHTNKKLEKLSTTSTEINGKNAELQSQLDEDKLLDKCLEKVKDDYGTRLRVNATDEKLDEETGETLYKVLSNVKEEASNERERATEVCFRRYQQ